MALLNHLQTDQSEVEKSWHQIAGQLSDVLDASDVGVWHLDLSTGLATWDRVASRIISGVTAPQVIPCALPIHPDDQDIAYARLKRAAQGHGAEPLAIRILRPDGVIRWIRASGRPQAGNSAQGCLVGIVTDFTAEKEAQARIVESERQLSALVNHLPGVAYRCENNEPWRMTYVSHGVLALTGHMVEEFTSGRLGWAEIMDAEDLVDVAAAVEEAIRERRSFDVSYRIRCVDGSRRWVQERGRAYYENDEAKFLEGFIWDTSDAKSAQDEARWIANHDALTGLPNRVLVKETIDAKAANPDATFAVLLLDVDDFKRVNDTLGHAAGDVLLQQFANRLKAVVGPNGLVGRLGGDEFAIVIEGAVDEDSIVVLGKRILDVLAGPIENDLGLLASSASVGASIFGPHGRSWTELLKNADIALYAAKASGRGNLKLFSKTMLNEIQVRNSMLALATSAIEGERIIPHYQPQIDLRSGETAGFEALLRWQGPLGDLQLPHQISAAFDDPLLATRLSDQMIQRVVDDLRSWLDQGISFGHVAINASSAQFRRDDFADRLLEQLRRADVPPSRLQVEVTETVFLGRGSRYVEKALATLNQAGVGIALDDFGTGYASLLHLAQYPVKVLKIDRSFVRRMIFSNHDDAIIQAVISLGHSLGMRVVAEGVETLEQQARLRAKGCDYAQGFFYARAMPGTEISRYCRDALRSEHTYAG